MESYGGDEANLDITNYLNKQKIDITNSKVILNLCYGIRKHI